jgi:hypothetical protein
MRKSSHEVTIGVLIEKEVGHGKTTMNRTTRKEKSWETVGIVTNQDIELRIANCHEQKNLNREYESSEIVVSSIPLVAKDEMRTKKKLNQLLKAEFEQLILKSTCMLRLMEKFVEPYWIVAVRRPFYRGSFYLKGQSSDQSTRGPWQPMTRRSKWTARLI